MQYSSKLFNPKLKITSHPELTRYLAGEKIVPINIELSICGRCNVHCPWCFYDKQSGSILDFTVTERFILECESLGVRAITFTGGGEPTLHPRFKDIIKISNIDKGLITNGLNIPQYDPSVFQWIRVSKTEKDLNLETLKKLRECKKLGICINYIGNEDEVKEMLEIAYKLNIDYVQVRPALNTDGALTFITPPNIVDEKLESTPYKFKEAGTPRNYSKCTGFNFVPFIWENGDLDVCAHQKGNKNYTLGNIYKNSLKEILATTPRYVPVESNCQICCKNHELNDLINSYDSLSDRNFV